MRTTITFTRPQQFVFQDSVHAALVAGLAAAGGQSADLVGPRARPWAFAIKGFSRRGGESVATEVLVSSPDPLIGAAMAALEAPAIAATSTNGDTIDCEGALVRPCRRLPAPGQDAAALAFASPLAIVRPKSGREATRYAETVADVDLSAALKRSVETRAGRSLDLEISVDTLALQADVTKRIVWLRQAPSGKRVGLPTFRFPFAMRGTPADLLFAYLAGFGAKTRQGFGLPILAT